MKLLVLCQDPDGPVVRHRIRAIEPHLHSVGFDAIEIDQAVPSSVDRATCFF